MRFASNPPAAPEPLLARLTAPAGAPWTRLHERAGATVMSVPGRYCVSYLLVGAEGVAVADVGSRSDVPRLLEALRWLGRPPEQVRFVVPTHLHFDHITGIDDLSRTLKVPVALGEVAAEHVQRGRKLRWPPGRHLLRATVTWIFQGMPFPPQIDLEDRLRFGFPWADDRFTTVGPTLRHGEPLPGLDGWCALATPGHADDAISLYHAGAGFLIAGDEVRNFLGGEWNPLICDVDAEEETRRMLRGLPIRTIFPAHGPVLEGENIVQRLRSLPFYLP
jgi:glyoxylase-like metal-dependent hydrolase (beta-lactamase superfamily II)